MSDTPIIFPFAPNWKYNFLERFRWLTEVFPSYNGEEQRFSLRQRPRIELEFTLTTYKEESRLLNSILFGWQSKLFTMPFWHDLSLLTSSINIGVSTIPVITYGHNFIAGEPAILWSSYLDCEEVIVDTINENSIVITGTTENSYSSGSLLLPARYGYIQKLLNLNDKTSNLREVKILFKCNPTDYLSINYSWEDFDNHKVFSFLPERTNDLKTSYNRIIDEFDSETGTISVFDRIDESSVIKNYEYKFSTYEEILQYKSFLLDTFGRRIPFWFLEETVDLKVNEDIGSTDTEIKIENISFTTYIDSGDFRNRLYILLKDGTVFYREVENSVIDDEETETITIDTAFGQDIEVNEIEYISYMLLGRLIDDSVEIKYNNINNCNSSFVVKGVKNVLTTTSASTTSTTSTSSTTSSTTTSTVTISNTISSTTSTTTPYERIIPATWTNYPSSNDSNEWMDVCYSEDLGRFLAVSCSGTSRIMYSDNGENWTGVSNDAIDSFDWYSCCWSEYHGLFIIVGDGTTWGKSEDGIVWELEEFEYQNDVQDFKWIRVRTNDTQNSVVCLAESLSGCMSTGDCERWVQTGDGRYYSPHIAYTFTDMTSMENSGKMLATASTGGWKSRISVGVSFFSLIQWFVRCLDENNDETLDLGLVESKSWSAIAYSLQLNLSVAVSNNGEPTDRVLTSDDTYNWYSGTLSDYDSEWNCICWAPGFFCFVALASNASAKNLMYSFDGFNWEYIEVTQAQWQSICWAPDKEIFVVVANSGTNRVLVGEE